MLSICILAVFPALSAAADADDCTVWYRFNESSSPTVDFCQDNDGLWTGSPTTGQTGITRSSGDWGDGDAYSFDGSNDRVGDVVVLPDYAADSSGGWSISAWVKSPNPADGSERPVSMVGNSVFFGFELTGSGTWEVNLRSDSSGNFESLDTNEGIDADTWHHVVVTADKKTGRIVFYENGTVVYNETNSQLNSDAFSFTTDSGALGVGAQTNDAQHFNGELDEVRVYNTTLSSSEVSTLHSENTLGSAEGGGGGGTSAPTVSLEEPVDGASVDNPVNHTFNATCYGTGCDTAELFFNDTGRDLDVASHQIDSLSNLSTSQSIGS